ncbi:MAG TPA: hypothetical protein VJ755_01350 [Gemmatimonadales bacterium]|nr:hypothetical protein [Gemmatimonadales bacterium]
MQNPGEASAAAFAGDRCALFPPVSLSSHRFQRKDLLGQIIGVEAEGVLQLSGGVLGGNVVAEDFLTTVAVTSSVLCRR